MAKFTPHTAAEIKEMLAVSGAAGIDGLFKDIPENLRPKSFDLPQGMTEYETMKELTRLSCANTASGLTVFAGGGYYDHFIPAAVDAISSRAEFYTAYTPYQPEASQGTLQAIFEYQTMMANLAGLDFSNASLYDGGTALYEAIAMAVRTNNRTKIVIDAGVNPLYRRIVDTYTANLEVEVVTADLKGIAADRERIKSLLDDSVSALVLQNPNWFGIIDDYSDLFEHAAAKGITKILVYYPMSLGTLRSPGEMKADIAVADGQSLGQYLSFGGPYLGIMAATKGYVRKMPGRIVGETVDKNGKKVYVLTLQAREQHIRREKATSNICSNQALCALRSVVYLSLLGKQGFKDASLLNLERAEYMKAAFKKAGMDVLPGATYNEFTVKLPCDAMAFLKDMESRGYLAGVPAAPFYPDKKGLVVVAATEKRTTAEIDAFAAAFARSAKGAK